MIYMFCYDIADPKRLSRVSKKLQNFGIRIQYSFFQCEMDKERMEKLKVQLVQEIDIDEDFLFIYPLCDDCSKSVFTDGTGEVIKIEPFEIL